MKHTKSLVCLSAFVGFAGIVGCSVSDVNSEEVRTSRVHAKLRAISNGDGTTKVTAQLREGSSSGDSLQLSGGDKLIASTDTEEIDMTDDADGDLHKYTASFDTEEPIKFQIAFDRGEENDDALSNQVTLPKPYKLSFEYIEADDPVRRGDNVTIAWDNSQPGQVEWEVEGDCIWKEEGTTEDDGSFSIHADDIKVKQTRKDESCTVQVTLRRLKKGTIDGGFNGGDFVGIQQRVVNFRSVPFDMVIGIGGAGY